MAHVLIADDEPLFVQGLQMFLEAEGHTVQTAGSAEDAISAFDPKRVDFFITDYSLGESYSGTDLAREFQKQAPRLRVIVVSGYSEATIRAEAKDVAHLRILTKPLHFTPLRSFLEETPSVS